MTMYVKTGVDTSGNAERAKEPKRESCVTQHDVSTQAGAEQSMTPARPGKGLVWNSKWQKCNQRC